MYVSTPKAEMKASLIDYLRKGYMNLLETMLSHEDCIKLQGLDSDIPAKNAMLVEAGQLIWEVINDL